MQAMKFNLVTTLIVLGSSLFTGIIIVSIGLGAAFPPMEKGAAPFICSGKTLQLSTQDFAYGFTQGYTITWYCVDDQTGAKDDVSGQTILVAGLVYSVIIFALAMIWVIWAAASNRGGSNDQSAPARSISFSVAPPKDPPNQTHHPVQTL